MEYLIYLNEDTNNWDFIENKDIASSYIKSLGSNYKITTDISFEEVTHEVSSLNSKENTDS